MRACRYVGLFLGLSTVVACDARPFWQRFSEPNVANCLAAPTMCAAGEVCNTATEICEPAFELQSVTPDLASGAGGARLELVGRNFRPDMTVRFGQGPGAVATDLSFVDPTHVSVTLPKNPGLSWPVPVSVEVPGQVVTRSGLFSYYAATLSFASTNISSATNTQLANVGDFNNDGKLDVLLTTNIGANPLISTLIGKGDGTFTVGPTLLFNNRNLNILILQDINRDNYPDLLVGSTKGLEVLINNRSGGFGAPQTVPTDPVATDPSAISLAVGDWNNDGLPDVAAANQTANSIAILLNNGAGSFGAPMVLETGTGPEVVLSGDFDGNQKPDLITLATATPVTVRLGDNQANFPISSTPSATGCDPAKALTADMNQDGPLDIIIICRNRTVRVLLGNNIAADDNLRATWV